MANLPPTGLRFSTKTTAIRIVGVPDEKACLDVLGTAHPEFPWLHAIRITKIETAVLLTTTTYQITVEYE